MTGNKYFVLTVPTCNVLKISKENLKKMFVCLDYGTTVLL